MNRQPSATGRQLLQRQPDMVFSRIDDEVVMMSIETGEYYGLNPVASRIWDMLATPHTFAQLIDRLRQEFNVDETSCRQEVRTFLQQMMDKNLVIAVE